MLLRLDVEVLLKKSQCTGERWEMILDDQQAVYASKHECNRHVRDTYEVTL